MGISRKPPVKHIEKKEVDIDSIINRGGSVSQEREQVDSENHRKQILIKLYQNTVKNIEDLIKKRKVKISRHQWIEEAIQEKIEKDLEKS